MTAPQPPRFRALTNELANAHSPVRIFFDERFSHGLRDVQRDCRPAGALVVPPTKEVNAGTLGTAADWLMRFLLYPSPDVRLAAAGAGRYAGWLMGSVIDLAELLRVSRYAGDAARHEVLGVDRERPGTVTFIGPTTGNRLDADLLARGCWALALLTDLFRAGPIALAHGPLGQLDRANVTAADLLALAPAAALDQLAQFRTEFEQTLIPWLANRRGPWTLGATFAGSTPIGGADAELIAAGLLLDLKTSVKLTLAKADLWQLVGYTLLDYIDEYQLDSVGLYFARYRCFSVWKLQELLDALAGQAIDIGTTRHAFRELLQVSG